MKAKSTFYNGAEGRGNPCYVGALGPFLLRKEDIESIESLPKTTEWFPYLFALRQYEGNIFVTLGYTSSNNPHWNQIYTYPEPFNDVTKRYWHTEANMQSTLPIRIVNFLLKKVSD